MQIEFQCQIGPKITFELCNISKSIISTGSFLRHLQSLIPHIIQEYTIPISMIQCKTQNSYKQKISLWSPKLSKLRSFDMQCADWLHLICRHLMSLLKTPVFTFSYLVFFSLMGLSISKKFSIQVVSPIIAYHVMFLILFYLHIPSLLHHFNSSTSMYELPNCR